jgi:hypothetical protein
MYKGEYDHELFSTSVLEEQQQRRDAELVKNQEIGKEVQRLRKGMDTVLYRVHRVVVRLVRVAIGLAMFAVVYTLAVDGPLGGLVRVPMAALSFGGFSALLFWLAIFAGFLALSWTIAFGEPPGDDALRAEAERNLRQRLEDQKWRDAKEQRKKTRVAAAYSKSKIWGRLNEDLW